MTITIDTLTIGLGTNYTIEQIDGFDMPDINDVFLELPSVNRSQFVSNFAKKRVMTFKGTIVGETSNHLKTLRNAMFGTSYPKQGTLLPISITTPAGDTLNTTATLSKLKAPWVDTNLTYCDYTIELTCADVNFYAPLSSSQNLKYSNGGLSLDFGLNADVGKNQNTQLTFNYSGTVAVKPIVIITGAGTNFHIVNQKTGLEFILNVGLFSNQVAYVDVVEETVFIDGISYFNYASGFRALELLSGVNIFNAFVEGDVNANTAINFTYNNAYISI